MTLQEILEIKWKWKYLLVFCRNQREEIKACNEGIFSAFAKV